MKSLDKLNIFEFVSNFLNIRIWDNTRAEFLGTGMRIIF